MLTSNGQPARQGQLDDEDLATIVTYGSKSQIAILVTMSDSIDNDIDFPGNPAPKLPNSELIFQLLEEQAGDSVADTHFIIRHAITQRGTLAVLQNAHSSKGTQILVQNFFELLASILQTRIDYCGHLGSIECDVVKGELT